MSHAIIHQFKGGTRSGFAGPPAETGFEIATETSS
jgi:hypothetical protein